MFYFSISLTSTDNCGSLVWNLITVDYVRSLYYDSATPLYILQPHFALLTSSRELWWIYLGFFSLKKKIEDAVLRAEMSAPTALELEEVRRIKQEEIMRGCNLWDDPAKSNEILGRFADSAKAIDALKDLKYKVKFYSNIFLKVYQKNYVTFSEGKIMRAAHCWLHEPWGLKHQRILIIYPLWSIIVFLSPKFMNI